MSKSVVEGPEGHVLPATPDIGVGIGPIEGLAFALKEDPPAGDVPALTSERLAEAGFRHAFFTRAGGVSVPPWDTLNFAESTGDDPEAVRENRRRAAAILGVPTERLYFASQVHGTAFRVLSGDEDWTEVVRSVADITLSRAAGVGVGVRSADCVTVLVGDRETGAVAAIHSGWQGTKANVVRAGIEALRTVTRASSASGFIAAIGPHIERCCFEVGADVARALALASTAGDAAVIAGDKLRVDLRLIVRAQLSAEGLAPDAIDDVPGCTACDARRFHSFRRDGQRSGRMLAAIVARAASSAAP